MRADAEGRPASTAVCPALTRRSTSDLAWAEAIGLAKPAQGVDDEDGGDDRVDVVLVAGHGAKARQQVALARP